MMTTTRSLAAAALTLALMAAPSAADAQTVRYRVVQLAEIASAQTSCVPTAINANGDVVGYCGAGADAAFAVLWRGDAVVNLGRLDRGTFSHAFNISAAGDIIVGDGDDGDLRNKAVVKKGNGPWIEIDGSGGSYQGAYAITDNGTVFGNYSTAGSPGLETWDPVFWTFDAGHNRYDRNDLPKLIGTPTSGFSGAFVFAASRLGIAVGQATSDLEGVHAALWQNDAAHTLIALRNPVPGGAGIALGVSDDGKAAGRFYGATQPDRAVLWMNDAAHSPVILGALPGDERSTASAVNVNGLVVGASFAAGPSVARGFLFQNGAMKDLSSLLDPAAAGWSINEPAGINNGGVIVATATLGGVRHPVMLVPFTPEPIASVTLGASHPAPQLAGTSVIFNAAATGGASPYEFKFLLSDGASTSVVQDWSASSSFTWTPASADPDYQVIVWARSDGNAADAAEQSASLAFPIFSLVDSVAIGSDLASPQTAGATITFTASASGGTAPYQFKWLVADGTSSAVAQDWGPAASFTWTPSAAGTYLVAVWVRGAGNTDDVAEQTASMSFTIQVVTPPPPTMHDNRDGCKPLPGDRDGQSAPDFSRGHQNCSDEGSRRPERLEGFQTVERP
jgi:probable HAF family extracellular repeat protein